MKIEPRSAATGIAIGIQYAIIIELAGLAAQETPKTNPPKALMQRQNLLII